MRDAYWDIVKGLGIVAVVAAHASILAREFNWFHLEIFFFVSGFLFSAKKCLDYKTFFLHKLKTLWKPFVMYNALFFVLHDFFIKIHWISTEKIDNANLMVSSWINLYELPKKIVATILSGNVDAMCGATWFMAPFTVNVLLFGFLVNVSNGKSKYFLPVLVLVLFVLGVVIVKHNPGMVFYTDMAMMLLLITAAGFYLKNFCVDHKGLHVSELISVRNNYFVPVAVILTLSVIAVYFFETNGVSLWLAEYGIIGGG